MMTPAAQLAFQRAARIAPDHPGPPFFYGLALAQGGNYAEAERIWRQLLASAPESANYRRTMRNGWPRSTRPAPAAKFRPPPRQAPTRRPRLPTANSQ